MSGFDIGFAPFFSLPWTIGLVSLSGLLVLFGLIRGMRGSWLRLVAFALLALALFNPSLISEQREPIPSTVLLVTDRTDSQKIAGRTEQTKSAIEQLQAQLAKLSGFEVREVEVRNTQSIDSDASSAIFSAIENGLRDIPPEQLGGVLVVTDGQIHDAPTPGQENRLPAPLHALITGQADEKDRRINILQAPKFGIVGENQEITFTVEDTNIGASGGFVDVRVLIDGELAAVEQVTLGEETPFVFEVPHGGKTVIQFETDVLDGELTATNNSAFTVTRGIRENLRVLLVSGEPHAGERTWRNLLKSDASVDLVHFTILRPPEKQDGTPINQLSLIAFPTRELFIEKLDEFDLIIFDRYTRRGLLPILYFDNIARYVTDGGAILVAAGAEHADLRSIHRTALAEVLPVEPSGEVIEQPFKPSIPDAGHRHPVTRNLPGSVKGEDQTPDWSRWFRLISGTATSGETVMTDGKDQPLLVLDRPGEGRVAILMSDHVWLWARGFEGGGPHSDLLRRLAHWLMKEPELDEEALRAEAKDGKLVIERQSMAETAAPAVITDPSGTTREVELTDRGDGLFRAEIDVDTLGLYRITSDALLALAHVGPANPQEYANIISTMDHIAPSTKLSGGTTMRLADGDGDISMPQLVSMSASNSYSGRNWIGLRNAGASRLVGINQYPLIAGLMGMAMLLLAFAAMWAREGR